MFFAQADVAVTALSNSFTNVVVALKAHKRNEATSKKKKKELAVVNLRYQVVMDKEQLKTIEFLWGLLKLHVMSFQTLRLAKRLFKGLYYFKVGVKQSY